MSYTKAELAALVAFFQAVDGPDPELFAEIALRESGGNPLSFGHNTNGTVDRGLWQINSVHEHDPAIVAIVAGSKVPFRSACYIPRVNCQMAIAIWRVQGYDAWSFFKGLP